MPGDEISGLVFGPRETDNVATRAVFNAQQLILRLRFAGVYPYRGIGEPLISIVSSGMPTPVGLIRVVGLAELHGGMGALADVRQRGAPGSIRRPWVQGRRIQPRPAVPITTTATLEVARNVKALTGLTRKPGRKQGG